MPIHRTLKNVVKNHTVAEVKVREATSNDPWGPSTSLMSQIADLTYNSIAFAEVMSMIWKRLNDHGKNWRHVYKSLVLLDYLLKTGSEQVVDYCRENVHQIRTLRDFQYTEDGKDHGASIRERAKQLVILLEDDERYKTEREKTLAARERYAQNTGIKITNRTEISQMPASTALHRLSSNSKKTSKRNSELESARPSSLGEEDLQVQVALAVSREEHEEMEKKRKADLLKIQLALAESKKAMETLEEKSNQVMKSSSPPRLPPPTSPAWNTQKLVSNHLLPTNDPWSPGVAVTKSNTLDLWSSNTVLSQSSAPLTDPWGAPVAMSTGHIPSAGTQSTSFTDKSPWQPNSFHPNSPGESFHSVHATDVKSGNAQRTRNGSSSFPSSAGNQSLSQDDINDEFDLLSLRLKKHRNVFQNSGASFGQHSADSSFVGTPWDTSSCSSALNTAAAETPKKKKVPTATLR